jgi:toxin CptA
LSDRLRVQLGPSRWLAATVIVAHGAALAAAVAGLPAPAAAIVAAGLAASVIEHVRRALHRSPLAVAGLELDAGGGVAIAGPASGWSPARLVDAAVPVPWLAVVSLRDALGRRRTAVVLPDSLAPESFRRLRVWLRWQPPGPGTEARSANNPTQR